MSALAVCEKIRSEDLFQGHSEIQFAVVCDATKEPPAVLDDLHKAQVSPTENLRNAIIVHHCRENWKIDLSTFTGTNGKGYIEMKFKGRI